MKYEVRKEVEYGCTIFSVYNTKTNTRVNYFATTEEAQAFADDRQKADKMFPYSYTEQEAELVASNID